MADGLFGVPFGVTADDLLRVRGQAEDVQFQKDLSTAAAALPPGQRNVFQSFAQLGRDVGAEKPQLSDQERQALRARDAAVRRVNELKATPEYAAMGLEEQAFATQEALGQSALDSGDFATGTQILRQTAEQRRAKALAELQQEQAGLNINKSELLIDKTSEDLENLKAGKTIMVTPRGQDGSFDPTRALPVQMRNGRFYHPETGQEIDPSSVLPASTALDMWKNAQRGTGAGAAGTMKALNDFVSNAQRGKLKAEYVDVQKSTKALKTIGESFMKASTPEQVVGSAGGILRFADNALNTVKGTYNNFKGFWSETDENGNPAQGAKFTTFADGAGNFTDDINVPTEFEGNAQASQQYRSAVMQLTYAYARLAEPGARQLSDADIRNAMDALGVSSGNPTAIVQNLFRVMDDNIAGVQAKVQVFENGATLPQVGWTAADANRAIWGHEDPIAELQGTRDLNTQLQERLLQETAVPAVDAPAAPAGGAITLPAGSSMQILSTP